MLFSYPALLEKCEGIFEALLSFLAAFRWILTFCFEHSCGQWPDRCDVVAQMGIDDGTVWIKLIGDGYLFAIVGFTDKETNARVAEKFIKFFEGIPVDFSDEVGLCEQ